MTARFLSTPLSTRAMDVHSGSKVYTLTVSETCLVSKGSSMGPMAINFCLCCSNLVKFNITMSSCCCFSAMIRSANSPQHFSLYPERSEPQPEGLGGAERTSPDINATLIDMSADFF